MLLLDDFNEELIWTPNEEGAEAVVAQRPAQKMHEGRHDPALGGTDAGNLVPAEGNGEIRPEQPQTVVSRQAADHIDPSDPATWGKVPRNAACPCGTGKKYKHCHGRLA